MDDDDDDIKSNTVSTRQDYIRHCSGRQKKKEELRSPTDWTGLKFVEA